MYLHEASLSEPHTTEENDTSMAITICLASYNIKDILLMVDFKLQLYQSKSMIFFTSYTSLMQNQVQVLIKATVLALTQSVVLALTAYCTITEV